MDCSTVRRTVVVTARGSYCFSTSARSPEAARLAVFTLAGEADAAAVRTAFQRLRWAASMIFFMLRPSSPDLPAAPAALPSRDDRLMAETGEATPLRAWRAKFAAWAAEHPLAA